MNECVNERELYSCFFLPFEIIFNVYSIVISIQSPFLATGLVIMALHISYCNLTHTGIGYENSWSTVCNMNLRGVSPIDKVQKL